MRWSDLYRAAIACTLLGLSPGLQAADEDLAVKPKIKLSPTLAATSNEEDPVEKTIWERVRNCNDGTDRSDGWLRHLTSEDSREAPRFSTPCDVAWHKPVFILPYTYSRDYESDQTEVLFAVSAKLRPLGPPLYFAFSQRSFWSLYDSGRSRPFRETVFNPEVFYRWIPKRVKRQLIWGFDGGYEHESNGQDVPQSRSWDRLYIAPFMERGRTAVQAKIWYRIPENRNKDADDPERDDNPDIEQYYGYSEIHMYRRINRNRRFNAMVRYNPASGYGALRLEYLERLGAGDLFWNAYIFHGYGESLSDYNDSVTRVGIGFAISP